MVFDNTGEGCPAGGKGPGSGNTDAATDGGAGGTTPGPQDRPPGPGPTEVLPVGVINKQPEADDPIYYQTSRAADGKTLTVGPFNLTSMQIRRWADCKTGDDLNEMVNSNQLRPSTALSVKSSQFRTILNLLDSGDAPSPDMIQRFLPGDLQRAVATKLYEERDQQLRRPARR